MKGYLYTILFITSVICGMENPLAKPNLPQKITKKELLELIMSKNTKEVLFAIEHRRADKVIDQEILKAAEEQKGNEALKLSRAGSICLMLSKHFASTSTATKTLTLADPLVSSASHKSHHRHSSKKHKKLAPKEQLLRMIKKKDLKGITNFAGTTGVHFIDTEVISYAQKKYDLLSESHNKDLSNTSEFLILAFLKKYDLTSSKERRKSYAAVRSHSKKEERP